MVWSDPFEIPADALQQIARHDPAKYPFAFDTKDLDRT
jgi:hypothetical protein